MTCSQPSHRKQQPPKAGSQKDPTTTTGAALAPPILLPLSSELSRNHKLEKGCGTQDLCRRTTTTRLAARVRKHGAIKPALVSGRNAKNEQRPKSKLAGPHHEDPQPTFSEIEVSEIIARPELRQRPNFHPGAIEKDKSVHCTTDHASQWKQRFERTKTQTAVSASVNEAAMLDSARALSERQLSTIEEGPYGRAEPFVFDEDTRSVYQRVFETRGYVRCAERGFVAFSPLTAAGPSYAGLGALPLEASQRVFELETDNLPDRILAQAHRLYLESLALLNHARRDFAHHVKPTPTFPNTSPLFPRPIPPYGLADVARYAVIHCVAPAGHRDIDFVHDWSFGTELDDMVTAMTMLASVTTRTYSVIVTICQQCHWMWLEGLLAGACLLFALGRYEEALNWTAAAVAIDPRYVYKYARLQPVITCG